MEREGAALGSADAVAQQNLVALLLVTAVADRADDVVFMRH